MKVELLPIDDHAEKYKKKKETKPQYFDRVLSKIFGPKRWPLYRKDRYIAKQKDGTLTPFKKLKDGNEP